jgi:polysaccharide biosynthesis/export protein
VNFKPHKLVSSLLLGTVLFGTVFAAPAQKQSEMRPIPSKASNAAETKPGVYRLQVGDELELHVFSLPMLEKKCLVRVDGRFYHPVIGDVNAAGRTMDEIVVEVTKRFRKELKNPEFRIGLVNYGKTEVSVLGEVKSQGKFQVLPGSTILDILAQAGGLGEKADPDAATLLRGGKSTEIDLHPPSGADVPVINVQAGDILYVHSGHRISVAGEVQKPGVYTVSRRSKTAAADALKAAGGAKPTAALERVKLLRPTLPGPQVFTILPSATGEFSEMARLLQDGDTLVFPERQVVILGAISKQGSLPLQGGESLLDVVSSGGVTDKADLSHVILIKAEDVKAGRVGTREEYNLEQILGERREEGPQTVTTVTVRDGDLVFVPTKHESKSILESGSLLNVLFMARSLLL